MKKFNYALGASQAALGLALLCAAAPAMAQGANTAETAANEDAMDTIVVTAAVGDKTKLQSSVSVTSVSAQQIADFTPRSEAEVFRLIPGIQAEDTAGPGGNANIAVRGLPVATGGSPFVQLQEDGLPTVLFGDMNFGNNDYWTRYDTTVSRVEAVRGGGSSTFASQAPGAVINYISNTGEKEGGSISFSKAINYDENKVDFRYGGRINDALRFHVGGYFKDGSGPTHISYNASKSYQIKANITQDFADGRGFIRFNFKRLDSREPTYTAMPSYVTLDGRKVTDFSTMPNFDARKDSNQSIYNRSYQILNRDGQLETVDMDGIHTKATSFGGQLHYEMNDAIQLDNNVRWTDMSGNFRTQFLNVATADSLLGSTVNGGIVDEIRYANGPNAGEVFTGQFVNNNPNISTHMRDMGSFTNDLALSGKFDMGSANVTVKAGWFHMNQNIAQDWHVNRTLSELSGNNPAMLDLFDASGNQLTAAGQAGFNDNWGSCCARDYSLNYTNDAPYLSANYSGGGLDLDGSVRFDRVKASGWALGGITGPDVLVDGVSLPSLVPGGTKEVLDYTRSYTSWSLGALYAINGDTSVFIRASKGGRFNSDRQILSGSFNADGSLTEAGRVRSVDFVKQQEVGLKRRGEVGGARYTVEATLFRARFAQNTFELDQSGGYIVSNKYKSYGLEWFGTLRWGNFSLVTNATYSNSKKKPTGATNFERAEKLPRLTYAIMPTYDTKLFSLGFSVSGQTNSLARNFDAETGQRYIIPGQTYVNGFVKVRPMENLELGVNVSNIFNTLGYRGSADILELTDTTGVIQNSAVLGRTATASVKLNF